MSSPHVVVIGSINMDITVHAERLPRPGETVTGGIALRGGGGKGANAAVAAVRAGAAVRLVAAVGDDEPGTAACAELWAHGIDVGAVVALPGIATGTALIVVDAAGNNQIAVASGANHALVAEHVTEAFSGEAVAQPGAGAPRTGLDGACVVVSFEVLDAAIVAAAEAAAAAGATLVVDPAPARALPSALAGCRPILTPNQHEAATLSGQDEPEPAAVALVARTNAPVIVTLGERGALVADIGSNGAGVGVTHHPAPAVEAVDATGAGDTFTGVLATELARGRDLHAAVDLAVAEAAASVARPGAR
ncbi:MAG TPA: PfkB family carbohydrate kinase [Baekduia sp.]|nr:PfkB family carbohydrate kinase [Baekduia sp.]